jgi:GT2 family glycosyltransferase
MSNVASDSPLISVVIPTHQRAELLERSLQSLTGQTLPSSQFEVVVVDDGSNDETHAVCKRLADQLPLLYFRIENSGIAAAKNLGLFASRAPVVLFFDDDDLADPGMVEAHLEAHRAHPEENVAVLGYTTWAPELELTPVMEYVTEIGQHLFSYPTIDDGEMLDYTYFWGGRTSCKRGFLAEHGTFDQEIPSIEDIELGFRLAKHGLSVFHTRAAKSYMVRPITYHDFAGRCLRRGRSIWFFASRHSDPDVQRYCGVADALEKWPELAPSLEAKMARVRVLEQRFSEQLAPGEEDLDELYELYGWTFQALQARGISEAAAEVPEPALVNPLAMSTTAPALVGPRPNAALTNGSRSTGTTLLGASPAELSASVGSDEPDGRQAITPPIVIFGAPRSGTTYVKEILNAHPSVHISNETRLFVWAHRALQSLDDSQVAFTDKEQFQEYLETQLPTLIRNFYREQWPNASAWGDKNPHYAAPLHDGVLQTVADLFPGARFIHVIRDGRDVVASLIRKRHPGGEPWVSFEDAHRAWNSHVTTGHAFATRAAGGTVMEVRYEELITDDLAMARKICEFLNIDVDPRIVEFCERQRRQRTPMSGPTRDLSQGADRSDWEVVVSENDRREESINLLRENLVRFGYQL